MYLGIVIGNLVLSKMDSNLVGKKLLIVQLINEKRENIKKPVIALDTLDAGPGDTVLLVRGRESVGSLPEPHPACDMGINAIVDDIYFIKVKYQE